MNMSGTYKKIGNYRVYHVVCHSHFLAWDGANDMLVSWFMHVIILELVINKILKIHKSRTSAYILTRSDIYFYACHDMTYIPC